MMSKSTGNCKCASKYRFLFNMPMSLAQQWHAETTGKRMLLIGYFTRVF